MNVTPPSPASSAHLHQTGAVHHLSQPVQSRPQRLADLQRQRAVKGSEVDDGEEIPGGLRVGGGASATGHKGGGAGRPAFRDGWCMDSGNAGTGVGATMSGWEGATVPAGLFAATPT